MAFTLCTSGAMVTQAGANVSSTAKTSGAILEQFSSQAEGYINGMTRYDWVGNYGNIGTNFKPILADASACLGAMYLASYDPSGYTSRGEYEDIVNVCYDRAMNAIKVLADEKLKTKMGATDT